MLVLPKTAPGDAVGVAGGHDGADRAAPVLGAEGDVVEIEGLHQGRDPLGVEVERVDGRVARFVGETETDQVGGDDADIFRRENADDLAPQIAPGWIAVEEEDGRTLALVDEVHRVAGV